MTFPQSIFIKPGLYLFWWQSTLQVSNWDPTTSKPIFHEKNVTLILKKHFTETL